MQSRETGVAPTMSQSWLRKLIPGRFQPFLRGLRKRLQLIFRDLPEPYRTVYPFTQAHPVRQRNLVRLAETIVVDEVPGAIVECGVLDGGTAALMAFASRAGVPPRPIHLFDAWQGLPPTTTQDGKASRAWEGEAVGSPRRVRQVLAKVGTPAERIHIHQGWFHETFPTVSLPQVALLHIDCDFYEPTKLCLSKWYPCLSPGGFIQFDDYDSFSGCTRAVDEFLAEHPELRLETVTEHANARYVRRPRS